VQILRELGIHNVKISPCIVSNDGAENNRYHQPIFSSVRSQVDRLVIDCQYDNFELFDAYHELETKFDKNYDWCPFLQALCVIGADLKVYSCQDKAYTDKGLLGSIKEQGFAELWSEGKSKFHKINPAIDCRHHCVANHKNQMLHEYFNTDPIHKVFV
jgi:Fe-coproporphyrin III synthase